MRVLFDAFWWMAGPVSNRQVMREFVLAWEREFPQDRMTLAVPAVSVGAVRSEVPSRVEIVATRLRPQGVSAILELPVLAHRLGVDVIFTHNFTPLCGRSAVFVHDLMFVEHPKWFTRSEQAYFALMTLTLGRARWVLSSSSTEASRISRLTRSHPPVEPVGLGLSRALSIADAARPEGFDGVDDFLLSVGRLNERKNLGRTIEAAVASGLISERVPLIIVGEPGGKEAVFSPLVARAVSAKAVRFLGFVTDDQLAWLYGQARVFVFLSLDEGFGMPTLEAMHFGAPVVASNIAVFREILGDRATYVDPGDTADVANGLRQAYDAGRRDPVDVAALGYSWEQSVRSMRRVISQQ